MNKDKLMNSPVYLFLPNFAACSELTVDYSVLEEEIVYGVLTKKKLRGLSPRANYTD
jgi:hypothetical protein